MTPAVASIGLSSDVESMQLDAFVLQHRRDGADETVGISKRQLHQHRQELHVGHDAARKDLRVLHLAGHHGVADAGVLQER